MTATPDFDDIPPDGVITAALYAEGRRVANIALNDAGTLARRPGHFVWIGLHDPRAEVLGLLQQQFGLHELAVEDALKAHQRPKIELYGDTVFCVLRPAWIDAGRLAFGETHVFAARGFVVSVRHGPSGAYGPVRARCEAVPHLLREGEDYVLYAIMDHVVDSYFPLLETLETEVEILEAEMLHRPPSVQEIERIHVLRRDLESLRRTAVATLDICSRLERLDLPMIDPVMRPYFRDVHDHVIRINESIEALREMMRFAFEASLMLAAARQGDVTRRLAAWAAILAVPTAIAGIYGMNFDHMPELHWRWGYPVIMTVIAVACGWLYTKFRRDGWL